MKPTPTPRIFRSLDEIVAEVARVGTAKVDWAYLARVHFRHDSVVKFSEWVASQRLHWKLVEYDRGGDLHKGVSVVFSRPDETPAVNRWIRRSPPIGGGAG